MGRLQREGTRAVLALYLLLVVLGGCPCSRRWPWVHRRAGRAFRVRDGRGERNESDNLGWSVNQPSRLVIEWTAQL
jgi:hypothetical protein